MASIFGKILRHESPARIITTFNSLLPISPLLNNLSETNHPPLLQRPIDPIPFSDPQKLDSYSHPSNSVQFYPSFPFGFFLNSIPSTGFLQFDDGGVVSGDSPTIWADSVKKKRKKKMNKHKLKKLRKRLRRKT